MKPYKPISCSFYDVIEHYATLRQKVAIRFRSEKGAEETIETLILDTKTTSEGEFMLVKEEPKALRMDRIISIGSEKLEDFGECKIEDRKIK
ncbi:hypothetical protein R9C00_11300 [Flammeovirgaceae bacterium SG7u.111]|nr:hypothetical protein [Flammeovirgaceae bacterium SG7u.132]WPO38038.1 hypothetical protein R9C00_11300 [Flammeovirgaceae bacterium SG7u.111]